jgi:myosin heavy subunit
MSSIGKILTFVNVVLAGLFLGWAMKAINENTTWKDTHDTLKRDLEAKIKTADEKFSKLSTEKSTADTTLASLRNEIEAKTTELNRTKGDLDDTNAKLAKWQADLNQVSAAVQTMESDRAKLQTEKDKAVQAQHDAEKARDEATSKQLVAEKDLNTTNKAKSKVETELASLVRYTNTSVETIQAMPKIDGRVTAVSLDVQPGLISINKGKNDQVQRGFTFQIYDGSTYKGQARVEFVHDNMCSAVLTNVVSGTSIRQGDSASTQL